MNRKGALFFARTVVVIAAFTAAQPTALQAAGAENVQAAPLDPGTPSSVAAQFFRVEWAATRDEQGNAQITGHVYNGNADPAQNVQLRINELDFAGATISSVLTPVLGRIPAFDRTYFNVQVRDSPSYRIDVESFDFVKGR